MKATKLSGAIACAIAICALATSTGLAQSSPAFSDSSSADIGTGWNILSVPAAAFVLERNLSGFQYQFSPDGYVHPIDPTGTGQTINFWASVSLPTGAEIGHFYLYALDGLSNPSSRVVAHLRRLTGYGSICTPTLCSYPPVPPAYEDVASTSTSGANGYTLESTVVNPPHTIANYRAQYTVVASFENLHQYGGLSFKGVEIWWKRQISPAPSTASFTDVPPTAQFFAEVEAMKAAGITGGCTPTAFCPDSTVTRRQMAAFFARALGLYWQY